MCFVTRPSVIFSRRSAYFGGMRLFSLHMLRTYTSEIPKCLAINWRIALRWLRGKDFTYSDNVMIYSYIHIIIENIMLLNVYLKSILIVNYLYVDI